MVDCSIKNYNPLIYQNYGYYYPLYNKQDTISFNSNEQTSEDTFNKTKDKPQLLTVTKIAVCAGILSALAISADFIFCKGKHVKSILGFAENSKGAKSGSNSADVNLQPNPTSSPHPITPNNHSTGKKGGQISEQTNDISELKIPNETNNQSGNIINKTTNDFGAVKQFIRDDIKWKIPEYDRKVDTGFGHKYFKDGNLVMVDLLREGKLASRQIYTYDTLGKIVIAQEKQPNGYHCVRYLTKTEDGIRTVRYSKTNSNHLEMMIQDYNKQGQQIRLYQGSPSRNNGNLHKIEIKYNASDKVSGYVEYFFDGTIWEMIPVPNKFYTYDIRVKSGDLVKKYMNATDKDVPMPGGEKSSVFAGSVIPTPHRHYKEGAGLEG